MKIKSRKPLSVMLTLAMVLGLFAGMPLAASAAIGDYNAGDIAVIEAIIENNGLDWLKATDEAAKGTTIDATWMSANWKNNLLPSGTHAVVWSGDATNKRIEWLTINNTGLTGALDVSGLTELEYLDICNNSLTSLNVSGLLNLEQLFCDGNELTSLNVSGLTALDRLNCSRNNLTSLNVSGAISLKTYLLCSYNKLTSLDVSGLTLLEDLSCDNNSLTSLDVSDLAALKLLYIGANNLTALDLSANTALTTLNGDTQTASLTLTRSGAVYTGAIALNNPTLITSTTAITYAGGVLSSSDSTRTNARFEVETGNPGHTFVVRINFTYSGDGGGTYIPSQPTSPPPPSPSPSPEPSPNPGGVTGGAGDDAVDVPSTIDADTGAVTLELDADVTETLIEKALASADADAVPTVTLDLSSVEGATSAALNADAAQSFSDADVAVTVILPDAEITLAPEALAALAAASDDAAAITVAAAVVPMSDLQGMQAAQVKGYETVVSIDVFVGDTKVDVPLTVSLPYTLKANENPAAVRVWYMDENGNLTNLNGVYDAASGMITFMINHQSYFVVGYDPVALWANVFTDVSAGAWYYDAIAFANYHGLLRGVGDSRFAPQDSMTRAMFVQVLANLEGQPPSSADDTPFDTKGAGDEEAPFDMKGGQSPTAASGRGREGDVVKREVSANEVRREPAVQTGAPQGRGLFSDVSATAWYFDAVSWAFENGIVGGVGDGLFAPDRNISRQEMAVMLSNYAKFKGIDIPAHRAMPTFTDQASIAQWAEAAARAFAEAGVLSGSNNSFNPQDNATRAEVATMFCNFMRLVV